jgi:hypothetical protein
LARKINREKGNLMLEKGNFIEDLWKHCYVCPQLVLVFVMPNGAIRVKIPPFASG